MPDNPVVADALAFQKLSGDAFNGQRIREDIALSFQVPENQWPDDAKVARAGQSINGVPVPPRPMMSIPILEQPIQLQNNQYQQAHLGVNIHPKDEGASDDTAEVIQGLYRDIEVESRAGLARGWGFDRSLKAGFGGYRIDTPYDDESSDPRDLKIAIMRVLHQSSIFWDPYAQQPDFSDGTRLLVTSYVPFETYKREYPTSRLEGYGDDELSQLATDYPFWINSTNESRAVCVAEFFYTDYKDRVWVILKDGSFAFADEADPNAVAEQNIRTIRWPTVYWAKLNAVEILEGNQDKTAGRKWNGKYIPFVPTIGKELQPFKGDRRWVGMIEPNMDAARLVNYEVSNAVEKDALAPKAPYVGAVGQFKTMRKQWDQANVRNFSTLEYDPIVSAGILAPPPQRNMVSPDLSSALQLVDLARGLVQVGTATTDSAALEQLARKRVAKETIAGIANQGDIGNSNYITNMATISMTHEARIVLDLIPKIYDRPGRVVQVLGMDNKRRTVMLNQPFVVDPTTKRPRSAPAGAPSQPGARVLHYDLTKGRYGFVVEIGKSYQTRMQQGSDAFGQLIAAQPELITLLGDIWMQFQDFPGHTEAAKRMKAMLPPPIKAMEDADEAGPEAAQAKLAQAGQMIQQLTQQLQQLQQAVQTEQVKQEAESQRAQLDNATKYKIAVLNAETDYKIEQMKADLAKATVLYKSQIDAINREDEQRHEVAVASADAAHTAEQAERAAARAAEMLTQEGVQGAMASAGDRDFQSEEAERGRQATATENEANRQAAAESAAEGGA